ncbi:MAG: nickel pincer cofactor biosynthesis protein LarB [Chloroflexota bacterium]
MSEILHHVLNGLSRSADQPSEPGYASVRADVGRESRKGVPEVILADRKRPDDSLAAVQAFLDTRGRAILSRTPDSLISRLRAEHADCVFEVLARSGTVVVKRPDFVPPAPGGRVGVLTAGTSDIPVAEEAQVVAAEMGCEVYAFYDVGVAGIHRLADPLRVLSERAVDVIIVAAGMDGALPSVVCGLVDVPVIGLPTPIGYGLGGEGVAALMTMLQTCAPGLTVVNIGNGVGAGATAGLIANRMAAARRAGQADHVAEVSA